MTFTFRVCAFVAIFIGAVLAWHWTQAPSEATSLAVQQFQDDGSVAARLRDVSATENWWPLVWPALLVVIGVVMFWDDAERLWKSEAV